MGSERVDKMGKDELAERIRKGRGRLEETLRRIPEAQMLEEVEGGWRVMDYIAHISAWERRVVERVEMLMRGEKPPVWETEEEFNAVNAADLTGFSGLGLAEARAEFEASFRKVLALVDGMEEQDLNDTGRYDWLGKPLWMTIGDNTWWHYEEHNEALQRWLDKRGD